MSTDEWRDFLGSERTVVRENGAWFSRNLPPDRRPTEWPATVEEARRWFEEQGAVLTVGVLGDEAYADVTHPQEGRFSSYAISTEPDLTAAEAVRRWVRQHHLNR